jgi:hypothetical protein
VEAKERLEHLRAHGPTPYSFTFKQRFSAGDPGEAEVASPDDWLCPA